MKILTSVVLAIYLISCNDINKANNEKEINDEAVQIHKIDSNFVLYNIKDLEFIKDLNWDFNNLFYGKSKNQKFEKLDDRLKLKYLYKFVQGGQMDQNWFKMDLQAFIVAKQTKINNFQPTLIKVYGTDYAGLFLVNLDNQRVISGFPIYDLEISGPEILEDTLVVSRPKTFCKFKGNKLYFKIKTGTFIPKDNLSLNQNFSVKEVNYTTTIDNSGRIKTEKRDSIQYVKKCELEYFQTY